MTGPLDLPRFRDLADAYGGAVARWPAEHRAEATRLAASAEGAAILAQASALDERLDVWRVPSPSAALAERIAAGAPGRPRGVLRRARLWWSGAGVAAALAGAAAGTAAVAAIAPADPAAEASTTFGDLPDTGEGR